MQTLVKEICPTTTQQWVKEGALLVDVRVKEDVAQSKCDVPNYLNIPLSEFEDRFQEIPREGKVVMICQDGTKSLRAAGFLVNHAYENVVNMQHGLRRWLEKGFPMMGDTPLSVSSCCTQTSCC